MVLTQRSRGISEPDAELDRLAHDVTHDVTHDVIGAAIEVHRCLGPGFLEAIYEEALCLEMAHRQIPFVRQSPVPILYKGMIVGEGRLDILVGGRLIVELKAVKSLAQIHYVQLLSYIKAYQSHRTRTRPLDELQRPSPQTFNQARNPDYQPPIKSWRILILSLRLGVFVSRT